MLGLRYQIDNVLTVSADLAQLAEHLICNQRVSGSNPLIGMGLWKETALMRNLSPQVHLVTTYHPRCWEDMLLRCSLDAERLGQVIGIALYQSATSFLLW